MGRAARAGAAHVIGIDASDIIESARRIVSANKLTERLTLLRGTMETVQLPAGIEKVDGIREHEATASAVEEI